MAKSVDRWNKIESKYRIVRIVPVLPMPGPTVGDWLIQSPGPLVSWPPGLPPLPPTSLGDLLLGGWYCSVGAACSTCSDVRIWPVAVLIVVACNTVS